MRKRQRRYLQLAAICFAVGMLLIPALLRGQELPARPGAPQYASLTVDFEHFEVGERLYLQTGQVFCVGRVEYTRRGVEARALVTDRGGIFTATLPFEAGTERMAGNGSQGLLHGIALPAWPERVTLRDGIDLPPPPPVKADARRVAEEVTITGCTERPVQASAMTIFASKGAIAIAIDNRRNGDGLRGVNLLSPAVEWRSWLLEVPPEPERPDSRPAGLRIAANR